MTTLARILLLALLATAVAGGCRKKKRHFEPAPKVELEEPDAAPEDEDDTGDGDMGDGDTAGDGDVAADGDGGPVVADNSGDGDGDGDSDGDLPRAKANQLVAFLDKELPADLPTNKLFTKLARKCAELPECVAADCRSVLASCSGGDVGGCGNRLLSGCSAFGAYAQGSSGEQLVEKTDTWLRDLWGDLLVKVRLALPEKKADKVDDLAQRHQL